MSVFSSGVLGFVSCLVVVVGVLCAQVGWAVVF